MYWDWSSGSFPSSDFYAIPLGVSAGSAPTGAKVYEQVAMTPGYTSSSTTIPAGHYKITEVHHSGYMHVTSSAQTVYSAVMGTAALAGGFSTLHFDHSSGSTSEDIYSSAVDPVK